ncbi:MAG TPA: class I SAM-dependent methyltransferase, partial [Myxococcales bacterium]|nr:class I SAM-dependent methyltransferase [Myxococcales bacterium]
MPGRRDARVEDAERWVFNRLAAAYQSRPGYPAALVDRLAELAGPGRRVVDLGAGTGDLAIPLAARGLSVAAVEPARRMLDVLARRAADEGIAVRASPAAEESASRATTIAPPDEGALRAAAHGHGGALLTIHAAAEATGLGAASFGLAIVADALHWLDPELAGAEIARLLAPGGALAIVEVELLPSPFSDALWPQIQAHNPKVRPRALDLSGARTHLFSL